MSNLEQQEASALAERIRIAFGHKNLRQISRELKISYSGLNHILHGRRRVTAELLRKISQLTGYSIHWLVTNEGNAKLGQGETVNEIEARAVKEFLEAVFETLEKKAKPPALKVAEIPSKYGEGEKA